MGLIQKLMGKIFLISSNEFFRLFWHDRYKHVISHEFKFIRFDKLFHNKILIKTVAFCI